MNHIQKLQLHKNILLELYHACINMDDAVNKLERTAYKGDGRKALQQAQDRWKKAMQDVETNVLTSTKTEEVKNAG